MHQSAGRSRPEAALGQNVQRSLFLIAERTPNRIHSDLRHPPIALGNRESEDRPRRGCERVRLRRCESAPSRHVLPYGIRLRSLSGSTTTTCEVRMSIKRSSQKRLSVRLTVSRVVPVMFAIS
jgi:hypothetical protein